MRDFIETPEAEGPQTDAVTPILDGLFAKLLGAASFEATETAAAEPELAALPVDTSEVVADRIYGQTPQTVQASEGAGEIGELREDRGGLFDLSSGVDLVPGVLVHAALTRDALYERSFLTVTFSSSSLGAATSDLQAAPVSLPIADSAFDCGCPACAQNDFSNADLGHAAVYVGSAGTDQIDGVLSGVKWAPDPGNGETIITFSFPQNSTDYGTNGAGYQGNANNQGFAPTTAAQQALIRAALDGETWFSIEGFTLATVIDLGNSADGMIRAAYSTDAGGSAYAYYPASTEEAGDMWFRPDEYGAYYQYGNPELGSTSWRSTLHEIGHALGLSHGHTANGGFNALPEQFNHHEYSLMTYYSWEGKGGSGYSNGEWSYPQSFMMSDIAALQHMYGADFSLNAGDTVYTFDPNTGEMFIDGVGQGTPGGNKLFLTIWDGDGIDTYDLSNYTTSMMISLMAGDSSEFSQEQLAYLGNGAPNAGYARGNVYNALQYNGDARSLIENAIGGSSADAIVGNAADNRLEGRGGHDVIAGLEGNDVLIGGAGDDLLMGDEGYALTGSGAVADDGTLGNIDISTALDVTSDFSGDPEAWVIDGYEPSDLVEHAGLAPFVSIAGTGTGSAMYYAFTILSDDTRVVFDIDGGYTDGGLDSFDSVLTLYDANGTILATNDDSSIWEGAGGSVSSWDSYLDVILDTAGTYFVAVSSHAASFVPTGATFALSISSYGMVAAPLVSRGGTINGDDTLYGGEGNDVLIGGRGLDRLLGGDGDDRLDGGAYSDVLRGGAGDDFIDGGNGYDTVIYTGQTGGVTVNLHHGFATGVSGNDTLINVEHVFGSGHDDIIYGTKTHGNRLEGSLGNDTLYGLDGRDVLLGGADDDWLLGGNDVDKLLGQTGNDTLDGGAGTDFLTGGSGADTFVFSNASHTGVGRWNRDEIRDFNRAQGDIIDLSGIDADTTTAGDQAFTVVNSFTGTAGEMVLEDHVLSGVDVTIASMDIDGDSVIDAQIYVVFEAGSSLADWDFIL
ncbi:M10 family metallopeptidase C-terminal domain-containing protein [Thalassorhabdomicrobium marinisediminis]|uniref:M10 family metallopeptidase C-terminal domain-containing protein n=1 Tax=Thalassorhabdomicrobium marinisediminis TaxID=2170577 RepID=UPI00248FFD59|nr:M10 family metallopeptidase C-terminal domain-containing protein [Thalassorhabdomicrobium marinisediminis]